MYVFCISVFINAATIISELKILSHLCWIFMNYNNTNNRVCVYVIVVYIYQKYLIILS